jgi:hypothetical protein
LMAPIRTLQAVAISCFFSLVVIYALHIQFQPEDGYWFVPL